MRNDNGADLVTDPFPAAMRSWCSTDGRVRVRIDMDAYAFSVTCSPFHRPKDLRRALGLMERYDMEALDESECPGDILADGSIRVWFTPRVPVEVVEAHDVVDVMHECIQLPDDDPPVGPRFALGWAVAAMSGAGVVLAMVEGVLTNAAPLVGT